MDKKSKIRSIALALFFPAIGFSLILVLKMAFDLQLSKSLYSLIAFAVASFAVLWVYRKFVKAPFGAVSLKAFLFRLGCSGSYQLKPYILLGILLAGLTTAGMMAGSALSGLYVPATSKISLSHALFSLTPGIWEEIMFRGVMLILLLQMTRSLKKASLIQAALFALAHLSGFSLLALVDIISVFFIGLLFTYTAVKTRSLIPGIIFHYLHDTFVLYAQPPERLMTSFSSNASFYGGLWMALFVGFWAVKLITEHYQLQNYFNPYGETNLTEENFSIPLPPERKKRSPKKIPRKIFFINILVFMGALIEVSYPLFRFIIALILLINLFILIKWKTLNFNINIPTFMMNGIMSFTTGYTLYTEGSQRVYLIQYGLGFFYLILFLFTMLKSNKEESVENAPRL